MAYIDATRRSQVTTTRTPSKQKNKQRCAASSPRSSSPREAAHKSNFAAITSLHDGGDSRSDAQRLLEACYASMASRLT